MSEEKFVHVPLPVSPAPHLIARQRVSTVMLKVLLALLPGLLALVAVFGWGSFWQVLLCAGSAVFSEALILHLRQRDVRRALSDYSALLTGVLLGLCLPPLAPWWLAVIGSSFAIVFGKQLYGGLGMNPFNPAMLGYALLLISFPLPMTSWLPVLPDVSSAGDFADALSVILSGSSLDGQTLDQLRLGVDGYTMATPLDYLRTELARGAMISEFSGTPVFGSFAGAGWEWINLAFLAGGLLLLGMRVISWQIPTAVLGGLALMAIIFTVWNPDAYAGPVLHLFSGGSMLAAFFIATDPVSAATAPRARLVYGFGIGALTYLVRTFGSYPDAFAFAVLLMNIAAPALDHWLRPRPYGRGRNNLPPAGDAHGR